MKLFEGKNFLRCRIVCSALAGFYDLVLFRFYKYKPSSEWHRTILCLTCSSRLNQHAKKYARRIGYNFLNTVQEPALLRDCYRDITIVDESIFSTRFWQQYVYMQNRTTKDSDKKLLIIVDAPKPLELQTTGSVVVKVFRINYSVYDIIEVIRAFVLSSWLRHINQ